MRKRDFDRYYKRYGPAVLGMARKLAGSDDSLSEDLAQEAWMGLDNLDPSRATTNRDAWIRKALWRRMVDYLRANDPSRYESLDHRLACGDQVEQLVGGELYLITSRPRPPKLIDEDEYVANDEEEE